MSLYPSDIIINIYIVNCDWQCLILTTYQNDNLFLV